jgi:hypothetical protein
MGLGRNVEVLCSSCQHTVKVLLSVGISHKQKQLLFLYEKSDILPQKIFIFYFSNKVVEDVVHEIPHIVILFVFS